MNRRFWIATKRISLRIAKSDWLAAVFSAFSTARKSKTRRSFRTRLQSCRRSTMNRTKYFLRSNQTQRFARLQTLLTEFGIPFQVDDHLVRGLDYYDNIVFEFGSSAGAVAVGEAGVSFSREAAVTRRWRGRLESTASFLVSVFPLEWNDACFSRRLRRI